MDVLMTCQRSL